MGPFDTDSPLLSARDTMDRTSMQLNLGKYPEVKDKQQFWQHIEELL